LLSITGDDELDEERDDDDGDAEVMVIFVNTLFIYIAYLICLK
jgi:hypothetical protein